MTTPSEVEASVVGQVTMLRDLADDGSETAKVILGWIDQDHHWIETSLPQEELDALLETVRLFYMARRLRYMADHEEQEPGKAVVTIEITWLD